MPSAHHRPPNAHRTSGSSAAGPSSQRNSKRISTTSSSSGREQDAKMIGQWRIGRTIGKGSSGRVKIAKHALTGQYAAVKIVPKGLILSSRLSMNEAGARADKLLLGIEREIVIMKLIDHPNVLSLYDVWETNQDLYLIMEYVPGGELFDYLVRRGRLPPQEALQYFQQIIYAVDYCHRFNICHRDLKPENLLLDKDKNIKVADFGMAAWAADERMLETSCGSPHYASPEIVAGKAYNGTASDIWSCGIILFALLTGRLPFDDDNIRTLLQKVKIGDFDMPDDIQEPARDLLYRMLDKNPERRITMPEIISHPFFRLRPPRLIHGRDMPAPPSLNDMARPVRASEIDPDIMANLKTLWHGASEDDIYVALMSGEKTWEKAIYHLLIKYRSRHLENYNMEGDSDESDSESNKSRPRPHGRAYAPVTIASPAKKSRYTAPQSPAPLQIRRKPAPLAENSTIQHGTPPPRPQAPTPKKAAGAPVVESPLVARTPSKYGPRSPVPQGPRSPGHRAAPDITLQQPTPIKDAAPVAQVVNAPSSPLPQQAAAPLSPQTADAQGLHPLSPPHVDNEQLQTFLYEIANQLNTMTIRSSTASSSSGNSALQTPEFQNYLAYVSQQPPTPVTSPRAQQKDLFGDSDQFADALDDETEAVPVCSFPVEQTARAMAASPMPSQSPKQMNVGLGHAPARAPSRNSGPPPVSGRWSHQSAPSGSYRTSSGASSIGESPGLYTPNPNFTGFEGGAPKSAPTPQVARVPAPTMPLPAVPGASLKAERRAPAPPGPVKQASRPAPPRPTAAELQSASRGPAPTRRAEAEKIESLLGRDTSYVMIDAANTPEDERMGSWGSGRTGSFSHRNGADAFGMLKKRKKLNVDTSHATDASASTASLETPKRSWFNNLFSFKPATVDIVIRSDTINEARERVRRVLVLQGHKVSVVEFDGIRGLKCRMSDTRDVRGNVVKGVRFRAEFTRTSLGGNTFATSACLTLDKGAQSTFQQAMTRLEDDLQADSRNPVTGRGESGKYSYSLPSNPRRPTVLNGALAAPAGRTSASAPNSPQFRPASPYGVAVPTTIRY